MDLSKNIMITGAAGFIGSFFASTLNKLGFEQLILVDDFSPISKAEHHHHLKYAYKIHRDQLFEWLEEPPIRVDIIMHLGARTDTTEAHQKTLDYLNLNFTKKLWEIATHLNIPFIYASSAATYGSGDLGYSDEMNLAEIKKLTPLNLYGWSKQNMDIWALEQFHQPPFWAGLKFFNVYGPHENHKGRMASVVYHAYHQILKEGAIKLFKSHHPDYEDGGQMRDFIYVKDVINILLYFMIHYHKIEAGIYNVGTGQASTFNHLAESLFKALKKDPFITYIDTPMDIRDKYQYFTEASVHKLRNIGYDQEFYSLEEGIADYVKNYLSLS